MLNRLPIISTVLMALVIGCGSDPGASLEFTINPKIMSLGYAKMDVAVAKLQILNEHGEVKWEKDISPIFSQDQVTTVKVQASEIADFSPANKYDIRTAFQVKNLVQKLGSQINAGQKDVSESDLAHQTILKDANMSSNCKHSFSLAANSFSFSADGVEIRIAADSRNSQCQTKR